MSSHPNLFTIQPGTSFVDSLAQGVLERFGDSPFDLPRIQILLPTRRSCLYLRDAFLKQAKSQTLLLPHIAPIGDTDEADMLVSQLSVNEAILDITPSIAPIRRQILLAECVQAWGEASRTGINVSQSLQLAQELARLLDDMQRQEIPLDALYSIFPDNLSSHWQSILNFLEIITKEWPKILEENKVLDPVDRRNRLLHAQASFWKEHPPENPVIIAGSTGSQPATAALIKSISQAEQGYVILPAVDRLMSEAAWESVLSDDAHAQKGIAELLRFLDVRRDQISDWLEKENSTPSLHERVISQALLPSAQMEEWRNTAQRIEQPTHMHMLSLKDEQEEAETIAALVRESIENKEQTVVIATQDRLLAQRVSRLLQRWNIVPNNSAGIALADTPEATFLLAIAEASRSRYAPVPLLSLLKHPLCYAGTDKAESKRLIEQLEMLSLRGIAPTDSWKHIRSRITHTSRLDERTRERLLNWLDYVQNTLKTLEQVLQEDKPYNAILKTHSVCAEQLAGDTEKSGEERLWLSETGQACAAFLETTIAQCEEYVIDGALHHYATVLQQMLANETFRPAFGFHPRVHILTPQEARLLQHDITILAGVNEGVWPAESVSPWMNQAMRQQLGLDTDAHKRALAAHDFYTLFCQPRVYLTRSEKSNHSPTTPSCWWLRLEAYGICQGWEGWKQQNTVHTNWYRQLSRVEEYVPLPPPEVCPPVALRPNEYSITDMETLRKNPYGIYAKRILGLYPLDDLNQDPSALEFGNIVHEACERLVLALQERPDEPSEALIQQIIESLFAATEEDGTAYLWKPRLYSILQAVADEQERRSFTRVETERPLTHLFQREGNSFMLKGKLDRVEFSTETETVIGDYKTGNPPSGKQVKQGLSPQLLIEALMLQKEQPEVTVHSVEYWKLTGRGDMELTSIDSGKALQSLITTTEDKLWELLLYFNNDKTPYRASPDPSIAPAHDDYAHLARVDEWRK